MKYGPDIIPEKAELCLHCGRRLMTVGGLEKSGLCRWCWSVSERHWQDEAAAMGDEDQDATAEACIVCSANLGKPGGYAETGMCGPCCTGEADTFSEFGETW